MARTASHTTPNLGSQPLRGADFERAHSSVVPGEDVRDRRRGFTIVELLIVVVVIAILAAITIVAYNGITNRSKASAAATSADQAAKKVIAYAITNSDTYPPSLADAGVTDGSSTYQYRVDNSANPKTFCLTATTSNVSYFVSSASASPSSGACAGHGANGVATVTNLVLNPSFESNTATTSGSGCSTYTADTTQLWVGAMSLHCVSSSTSIYFVINAASDTSPSSNQSYSASAYVRSDRARGVEFYISARDASNNEIARVGQATTQIPANTWTRVQASGTTPVGTATVSVQTNFRTPAIGEQGWVDGVMLTRTTSPTSYADGDSQGWVWNGPPNASTSVGQPL